MEKVKRSSKKFIDDFLKRCGGEYTKIDNITVDESLNKNYETKILRSVKCDGTLMVIYDLMEDILFDLIECKYYYEPTFPKDESRQLVDIKYTIGDFEISSEIGNGTREKPWATMKFQAELPVKCEYILEEK